MNFKITLQGILIGIVLIIGLMVFEKTTKIQVPNWLGGILIIFFITLFFNRVKQ